MSAPRPARTPLLSFIALAALGFAGAAWAQSGPPDMLKDARFKAAYTKALGAAAKERWLMRLDGPAPLNRTVKVSGSDYLLISTCKPRDCYDHNLVLLWSAPQNVLYGKLHQGGRATMLGAPPRPVAAELDQLWKAEWRQQPK